MASAALVLVYKFLPGDFEFKQRVHGGETLREAPKESKKLVVVFSSVLKVEAAKLEAQRLHALHDVIQEQI